MSNNNFSFIRKSAPCNIFISHGW